MAFDITKFGKSDANFNKDAGPSTWVYATIDLAADIDSAGYFNDASSRLNVGDVINANVDTDGTPAFGYVVVNSNASGVVDTANWVAYAITDTD